MIKIVFISINNLTILYWGSAQTGVPYMILERTVKRNTFVVLNFFNCVAKC